MIYSMSSLESCVALREVNKAWYAAFQNSERAMQRKMKERNPGSDQKTRICNPGQIACLYLQEDFEVANGKPRSGKWETTTCLEDDLYVPHNRGLRRQWSELS